MPSSDGATVVSVNVGQPQTHDWQGREFVTAIYKDPVDGPVMLADDHVAGDEQADTTNHGGRFQAVYAYAAEDADWWAAELDRSIPPGMFGENLTIRGIDVSDAPIGAVWRVGDALLQVTAPRIPCSNLGLRFEDTDMPRVFQKAARPGAYLAILEPGQVTAGDAVQVVRTPDHDVTVAGVFRAYYDRDRDLATRLLGLDDLPPGWKTWAEQACA